MINGREKNHDLSQNVHRLMRANQDAPVDQMGTHQVYICKSSMAFHYRAILFMLIQFLTCKMILFSVGG